MVTEEGFVSVEGGRVWYQIVAPEQEQPGARSAVPLLVLHGGPGSSHLGMERLNELAVGRPVILYDQLGCGNSDRPQDDSLWTIDRFVRELATLRAELNLNRVHILGHSWGTMLLADYLRTKPNGVVSAIFSSPCLSVTRWAEDANRLRTQLPDDVQAVLRDCEENGLTDSPTYREAEKVYMSAFVCRVDVPEEEKKRRLAAFGNLVYEHMWGPSEFYPTGNLKAYDATDRLHELTCPTLFTCGRFDEATPEATAFYQSKVPSSQFHIFEQSSHSPLREQCDDYLRVISDFLSTAERTG